MIVEGITLTVGIGSIISISLGLYKYIRARQKRRITSGKLMGKVILKVIKADVRNHMTTYINNKMDKMKEFLIKKESGEIP
jgi:hypothetical protein